MRQRKQQKQQQRQQSTQFLESLEPRTLFSGGTVFGTVHNDVNGDGIADEFSSVPAMRAYIDSNKNGRLDRGEKSAPVDVSGRYTITNVPAGASQVRVDLPKGFALTSGGGFGPEGVSVNFVGTGGTITLPTVMIRYKTAPWTAVGQNAQHTGVSPFQALPMQQVLPVGNLKQDNPGSGISYGSPVITKLNTVIVPSVSGGQYTLRAFNRFSGSNIWTYTSNYVPPPAGSAQAAFTPALSPDGKLYFPGAAGQIKVIENPDRFGAKSPKAFFFYPRTKFNANQQAYRDALYVNTPITADAKGNIYFGVAANNSAAVNKQIKVGPTFVRITPSGRATSVRANVATGRAPVISNDGNFVYVPTQSNGTTKLERFRAGNLKSVGSVVLKDPLTGAPVTLDNTSTAAPVVGPNGDVFLPTPSDPAGRNAGNGWVLHFSADLKKIKVPASFNSDFTPAIVPASMVPSYHGKSTYLLLTKSGTLTDNDFDVLVLVDPTVSEVNSNTNATGMKVFTTLTSPAWYNSNVVVDPASGSIYAMGFTQQSSGQFNAVYKWNVSDPSQAVQFAMLNSVQANSLADLTGDQTPMAVGPDGEIYVISLGQSLTTTSTAQDATLYAIA